MPLWIWRFVTSKVRLSALRCTTCSVARAEPVFWSTVTPTDVIFRKTCDEVGKYISMGYRAVRAQTGIPGLPSTYGVANEKLFYEPAEKGLPPENAWSTEKY